MSLTADNNQYPPITGLEDTEGIDGPSKAIVEFYYAFNAQDLGKVAKNWAHKDDAIVMVNLLGGIKHGWSEIRTLYERIFSGPADVYVELHNYNIYMSGENVDHDGPARSGDMFYVLGREIGQFSLGSTLLDLSIRTTRVYRYYTDRWLQVHHHGSIDDPRILKEYQQGIQAM